MSRYHMSAAVILATSLIVLVLSSPVRADRSDGKRTCASEYPNAPTKPPRDYDYQSEDDAYMAFRRAARKAGFAAVKKAKRERAEYGPCVGHGEHLNMDGARPAAKGKKPEWGHIGSMTSCRMCEDTSRGPRLYKTLWRIHPKF